VTEEDRYSSVIRDAQQQQNYSHLQQRFQQQQQQNSSQQPQPPAGDALPASQDVRSLSNAAGPAAAVPGDGSTAPSPAKPPAWGNAGAGVAVLRCEPPYCAASLHGSADQPICALGVCQQLA